MKLNFFILLSNIQKQLRIIVLQHKGEGSILSKSCFPTKIYL